MNFKLKGIKMETRTINVYDFNELSEEAKKNVIENSEILREIESSDIDCLKDWWKDILEEIGFENVEIFSDVSFSQGSGTSFMFTGLNAEKIENFLFYCSKEYRKDFILFSQLLKKGIIEVFSEKNSLGNHYFHEKTVDIIFAIHDIEDEERKIFNFVDFFIESYIEPLRLSLCNQIQNELEDFSLHFGDDEERITDIFKSNNIVFFENGQETF